MQTKTQKAIKKGRTLFPKSVKSPLDFSVLKPVNNNSKLGKGSLTIQKGAWKGFPLYSLTLEERKTCPKSCFHYANCYGNNMPFAHRFKNNADLTFALEKEIRALSLTFPNGFAVRLHVLGDFYSQSYVNFWRRMLFDFPMLHIYGYTARDWNSIRELNLTFPGRSYIRRSTNNPKKEDIITTGSSSFDFPGIQCPEQVGKTKSCLTCGLCWTKVPRISFLDH